MHTIFIHQLRKKDIIDFPVWRIWTENGNEKAVPEIKGEISENTINDQLYIVLTEFTLNNKSKYIGFCSPQDFSGIDYVQPVILTDEFQIPFFKNDDWSDEEINVSLSKLNLSRDEVFPLAYEIKIPCDGQFFAGILTDFNKDG